MFWVQSLSIFLSYSGLGQATVGFQLRDQGFELIGCRVLGFGFRVRVAGFRV